MRQLAVAISVVLGAALAASPALAAFPGRNGLLAVAPVKGAGVVLVSARGGPERRICAGGPGCTSIRTPRWSPDGQVLAFSSSGLGISLLYSDGTCLDCTPFPGSRPAFATTSAALSAVSGGKLVRYGSDGLHKATLLRAPVSDAVWSARGRMSVVRNGRVLTGSTTALHALGAGHSPSWSPSGSQLAVVRGGWVTVLGVTHRFSRRLVKGSAPAWSPDGTSIAFIAAGHRVSVIPARGGRVRGVGHVLGRSVDWQPIAGKPPEDCVAPHGSTTVVSTAIAIVTRDRTAVPPSGFPGSAYMGCLRSTGRERLLENYGFQDGDSTTTAGDVTTAGDYAGWVEDNQDPHYGGSAEIVRVFDLRTGVEDTRLDGEQVGCGDYEYSCASAADGLILGTDGFTAVHTTVTQFDSPNQTSEQQAEQILAADSTGVHVLDSTSNQYALNQMPAPVLSGLALSGDTLTWNHAGTPQSAQLH